MSCLRGEGRGGHSIQKRGVVRGGYRAAVGIVYLTRDLGVGRGHFCSALTYMGLSSAFVCL